MNLQIKQQNRKDKFIIELILDLIIELIIYNRIAYYNIVQIQQGKKNISKKQTKGKLKNKMEIINHYKNQTNKIIKDFQSNNQLFTQDQLSHHQEQLSHHEDQLSHHQKSINDQIQTVNQLIQPINHLVQSTGNQFIANNNKTPLIQQVTQSNPHYIQNSSSNFPVQIQQNQNSILLDINPYSVVKPNKLPSISKCIVCHKNSKYRCPQCLISYCSSSHYKSHNLFCSQSFFKRQIQTQMKSIKSSKQEKAQIRQILKQHQQLQSQLQTKALLQMKPSSISNSQQIYNQQLSQQRLLQLLQIIENSQKNNQSINEQLLKLSLNQLSKFNLFIKNIQSTHQSNVKSQESLSNQNKESSALTQSIKQPYWFIPDGLDYYFMQNLQIQQFADSSHLQLIIYRQFLSNKYHSQIKHLSQLTKIPTSPLVQQDILQYLLIWALITLAWSSQINNKSQISQVIQSLYIKDLAKNIIQKGINLSQAGTYTLSLLRQNILNIKNIQTKNLLNQWYQANLVSSCKLIVKNKFLLIQTFLRLLQFFQNLQKDISSAQKVSKKRLNQVIRHVKKLQYLLSYIKDQMTNKQSIDNKTNNSQINLFRHLYRSLIIQQNNLLYIKQSQQKLKAQKNQIQEIKKHGLLINK